MSGKIKLKIITHDAIVFEDEAEELYVKSTDGGLGILANHVPVVCALDIGVAKIVNNSVSTYITIMAGILQFSDNCATVLTDCAELGCEIDIVRANLAKERAEARLNAKLDDVDVARAQVALAKALARIGAKDKI